MSKQIRFLATLLMIGFIAILINITYIQVFDATELRNRPGNQRVLLTEYSRERGPILVGDKQVAESTPTDDQLRYLREYSNGSLYAPATGFYSHIYGATGIERAENEILSGNDDALFVNRLQQLFANRQPKGGAVALTLDAKVQRAAYEALDGRTGAAVALDPKTGAILALVSSPSFNPNRLSSHDPAEIREAYNEYLEDEQEPMLNRPLVMTLPPGSTFKLVVAAAALESGKFTMDSVLPGPKTYQVPLSEHQIHNYNGESCGNGDEVTLAQALIDSCNTAFAWLAGELGSDKIIEQAERFGFNAEFYVPMGASISRMPTELDAAQTALVGLGQYDVTATALQMAQVVGAIGNGGHVFDPYLVAETLAPNLSVIRTTSPDEFGTSMSSANAQELLNAMVSVVDEGTGSNARIDGVSVAGKTGTAQNDPNKPAHAWFVATAPAQDPTIAVAVVLQHGGGSEEVSGNALAAPIAREMIKAYLK